MISSEISEIKKQFNHENCAITKVSGCYVDGEKEIKTKFTESFLGLAEEETFKYFEIFKKSLSGTIGKNLINMDFPMEQEFEGGTQKFLLGLRDSELKDEEMLEEFYQKIIQSYDYGENYLILIIHSVYDVPGKTKDNILMDDASDEVYSFILCSICPVKLSKPGLSYYDETNQFKKRIQDWVVNMPLNGFLFPAFNDRSTDIHSSLYYSKNGEELHSDFIDQILGCEIPLSAGGQKETFRVLIEETLGDECEYEVIRNIHDKLNEIIDEKKDMPEPVVIGKNEVKNILFESGIEDEKIAKFDKSFDEITGNKVSLLASNVVNTKVFEVKTPDVVIKVNPDRTDLVETKVVDGRKCLVIEINDAVEVNGIAIKTV